TVLGTTTGLAALIVAPPPFVRFLLGLAALLTGLVLVLRAGERLGSDPEPRSMIRGVRLVFLAVAAFAAAAGWFIGSPLPVVAGLVIAGVDVAETSFLMLVTAGREASPHVGRDAGRER
ncbi:MAG: hypothetical protein ACRDGL_02685, partial [Candidatus Limnocylindrales bacterium]